MSNPTRYSKSRIKRNASKFLDAIPLYMEAKRLSGSDAELKAACYLSLGDAYRLVGEFTKSGRCYIEGHRIVLGLNDESRAVDALVGLRSVRFARQGTLEKR